MYKRQTSKGQSSTNHDAPANQFAPRRFVIQPQTEEAEQKPADLQAKSQTTPVNHLANIPIFPPGYQPPPPPRIQMKLSIGEPGDKYEQEADKLAQDVVQRINSSETPPVQLQPEAEIRKKSFIQRLSNIDEKSVTPDLEASIQRMQGSGQPLAETIKAPMEQAFGADFSGVKIHTDAESDQMNQSIQAKAFTTGQDIFFRQGNYEPGSRGGQELIAHELTHVVQQEKDKVSRKIDNGVVISSVPIQIQRAGEKIGGGIAELYVPDTATTTVCFFGHGVYNNDIAAIDGVALGYFCPHQSALNSNLSMMEQGTLYDANVHDEDGKWHNYTLTEAHIGLDDNQAKTNCNTNNSALALITSATSTEAIVNALKAKGYTVLKAIHCREVNGVDNQEWDPTTDQAIEVEQVKQKEETVDRASLNGKFDITGETITETTEINQGDVYMDSADAYDTAKIVVKVDGSNLQVKQHP
ncbi:DUF4157 domain-containing protein [Aulosira sp. FACHB-615]|uniref:eCIS core domain-containing protein n=1 Tax=Aulosira sp. FACHB-615 TaxID=2692777 RepID=UPI001689E041|nr:DUF4157 domain-containing protein [Aulosira sp. FACHB-615]MBD2489988.1 DUF4157 domain-containing protein [Aulosira sp. FACHB-615]